ncbi:MAG: transporter [Steroidobacteraceae bacterium]
MEISLREAVAAMLANAVALALLTHPLRAIAGPPFQTDDPDPVDLGHYEFYIFSGSDGTPLETDPVGPALEFNWGALPNLQLHAVLSLGAVLPSNDPKFAPAGIGPNAYGLLDTELGVKYRFISQTAYRPEVGIFPMVELPTGSYSRGLGVGKTWYKLPLWIQKNFGPWTTYGGGGYEIVHQVDDKNFAYEGWLLQRDVGEKWTLGGEIFHHGAEGLATPQTNAATMLDLGGYYYFSKPAFQLLFAVGHTLVGQPEIYSYLGLYWTWGGKPESDAAAAPAAIAWSQAARLPTNGALP